MLNRWSWCLPLFGLFLLPTASAGQYLYMDVNGDGVRTEADVLRVGEAVPVDIWIRTDAGRGGAQPVASTDAPGCLTIFSYEFVVRADGGIVEWGQYVNHMSSMGARFGPQRTESEYYDGFGGVTGLPPGRYKLGSLSVRVKSGSPALSFQPRLSTDPVRLTSFGSDCPGGENDHTLKLGTGAGASASLTQSSSGDWFDADGVGTTASPDVKLASGKEPSPMKFSLDAGQAAALASGTSFRVGLPAAGKLTLRVYDLQGRLVRTVAEREFAAGWHDLNWNALTSSGRPAAAGAYFARGEWNGKTVSRKFTLLK